MQSRLLLTLTLIISLTAADVSLRSPDTLHAESATNLAIPAYAWTHPIGGPAQEGTQENVGYKIIDDGAIQGAPLGGIGAGTIGRTYNGNFARWHTTIGSNVYRTVPADMFSVFTKQDDTASAQALYSGAPTDGSLGAWNWNYPVGKGTYWALYPRSGYVYDGLPVQLSVEQFSPVIPSDYQASSYPAAIFTYTATNPGDKPVTVGLLFTWQNALGPDFDNLTDGKMVNRVRKDGDLVGVEMGRTEPFSGKAWDGSLAIGAQQVPGVTVSAAPGFKANGDGADIWKGFAQNGTLDDSRAPAQSQPGDALGAGVSATFTLKPGETLKIPFFLAWDQPIMTFGGGDSWYKRYTAFFGRDGAQAWNIVKEAARQPETWLKAIADWQTPILNDAGRRDWFKTALFNELYYIADGGSAWENGKVGEAEPPKGYMGRYALLECFDYSFYSTFDVDYYASFALMQLWPELEKRVIGDFAATMPLDDPTPIKIGSSHGNSVRKKAGALPHDLGGPGESPWLKINLYNWQDVTRWKDLNPKFVLRLYRDAILLNDPQLIKDNWDAVKQAMSYINAMDRTHIGIPENEGIPDQTYDTWPVSGVSAYSGGLYLAALRATIEMSKVTGDTATQQDYESRLGKATTLYEQKLWTGTYYKYDSSSSPTADSIQTDQLAGQWYLDYVKLTVIPEDHVIAALKTIYANNVVAFAGGKMGAVNGSRPDGSVDKSNLQSSEVWTGVTYALAATMMDHGLSEQAWVTARGVYLVTYEQYGYWFRTPEAYNISGQFRATMYMRPLSIWGLELAYKNHQAQSSS